MKYVEWRVRNTHTHTQNEYEEEKPKPKNIKPFNFSLEE